MKIIYCKHIPFKGFLAMNFFGVCVVRKEYKNYIEQGGYIAKRTINHESIHTMQMRETLYIGFYILYLLFWLCNLIVCPKNAYRNIAFEREAYDNEQDYEYVKTRKHFAWMRYLFTKRI